MFEVDPVEGAPQKIDRLEVAVTQTASPYFATDEAGVHEVGAIEDRIQYLASVEVVLYKIGIVKSTVVKGGAGEYGFNTAGRFEAAISEYGVVEN